ncbi:MAG: UbiX family flavin prenyltransferase [Oscillospiraceae bacterium]|nr:UbiX family flavin prenyltransferase [Oscillospiraceae bacterium]
MKNKDRIIIGVSGASGAPIAVELLRALHQTDMESHLIITKGGRTTIETETDFTVTQVEKMADFAYDIQDIGALPASGSYRTSGMVVVPCSMKTLAGIHSGYSDNLLLRAADVTLKEGRKLVLVSRECPMSAIHLRNQYELALMGAVILPPVLSYYSHPHTLEDVTRHIVGKILDQFHINYSEFHRWGDGDDVDHQK